MLFSIIVIENLSMTHLYYTSSNWCIVSIILYKISFTYIHINHQLNEPNRKYTWKTPKNPIYIYRFFLQKFFKVWFFIYNFILIFWYYIFIISNIILLQWFYTHNQQFLYHTEYFLYLLLNFQNSLSIINFSKNHEFNQKINVH